MDFKLLLIALVNIETCTEPILMSFLLDIEDDVAVLGVPCPLFSRLNVLTAKSGWNPFTQTLGHNYCT